MYSWRYHVLTIVGIFFALAIGLLLGVAVGRSNAVEVTTETMVQSLQESFDALQQQNDELETSAQESTALSEDLLGAWAQSRLNGQTVLVLRDDSAQGLSAVQYAVELAQGSVASVRMHLPQDASALIEALASYLEDGADTGADDLAPELARLLVQEWSGAAAALEADDGADIAEACPITSILVRQGALELDAPLEEVVTSSVVIDAAASQGEAEEASLALTEAFADAGYICVCAQLDADDSTLVEQGWARGISGIAGVDSAGGTFGLIWLMTGAMPGEYGTRGNDAWPTRALADTMATSSRLDVRASSSADDDGVAASALSSSAYESASADSGV